MNFSEGAAIRTDSEWTEHMYDSHRSHFNRKRLLWIVHKWQFLRMRMPFMLLAWYGLPALGTVISSLGFGFGAQPQSCDFHIFLRINNEGSNGLLITISKQSQFDEPNTRQFFEAKNTFWNPSKGQTVAFKDSITKLTKLPPNRKT